MSFYTPKIQDTEKGKFYYYVICPTTRNALIFEEDESEGEKPYPAGSVLVSCHHCQTNHRIDSSEVRSLQATGKE